jgi:hypothetical protein
MEILFTGSELVLFGEKYPATCKVRTLENGQRKPDQVVKTMGSTVPHGVPYDPAPFPPGEWKVTRVVWIPDRDGSDGAYWPVFIDTDATQELTVWELDDRGRYLVPTDETITGKGYGAHHARWMPEYDWKPSSTTLGCINILSPYDAQFIAEEIDAAMGYRQEIKLIVPPWEDWHAVV